MSIKMSVAVEEGGTEMRSVVEVHFLWPEVRSTHANNTQKQASYVGRQTF